MRKATLMILGMMMMVLVLAACGETGGGETPDPTPTQETASAAPLTGVFAGV